MIPSRWSAAFAILRRRLQAAAAEAEAEANRCSGRAARHDHEPRPGNRLDAPRPSDARWTAAAPLPPPGPAGTGRAAGPPDAEHDDAADDGN